MWLACNPARPSNTDPTNHTSREQEWRRVFRKAAELHGDQCVGLALGVRAMFLVGDELGLWNGSENVYVHAGTKGCLTEPFRHVLGIPKDRIQIAPVRDETLTIVKGTHSVKLHVTTRKFADADAVLASVDSELFPIMERNRSQSAVT